MKRRAFIALSAVAAYVVLAKRERGQLRSN